jgi:hypothetical protein
VPGPSSTVPRSPASEASSARRGWRTGWPPAGIPPRGRSRTRGPSSDCARLITSRWCPERINGASLDAHLPARLLHRRSGGPGRAAAGLADPDSIALVRARHPRASPVGAPPRSIAGRRGEPCRLGVREPLALATSLAHPQPRDSTHRADPECELAALGTPGDPRPCPRQTRPVDPGDELPAPVPPRSSASPEARPPSPSGATARLCPTNGVLQHPPASV